MLLAMRDKAMGWLGMVIIGILIIPFALWGVTDLVSSSITPYIAKVNGEKISEEEFKDEVNRMLFKVKKRPTGDQLRKFKDKLLDNIIEREVVFQAMVNEGYLVSDDQVEGTIRSISDFQQNGQFSADLYASIINRIGFDDASFRKDMKRNIVIRHFRFGVMKSEFISNKELVEILKTEQRTIALSYLTIPSSKFKDNIVLSENDLNSFYKKNKKEYMTVEKIKVAYIELKYKDIFDSIKIDEKKLKDFYAKNKRNYLTAPIRKASHIFFQLKEKAAAEKVAEIKKKAEAVLVKLKKGEKFSELVKKVSEDKLSPNGDLGVIDPEVNKQYYQAISELKVGEHSKLVRSKHGFHILKLTLSKAGNVKSYEQAKAEIEKNYKKTKAMKLYRAKGETLYNLTFENSETLDVAADKLKLKIQTSDWLTRQQEKAGLGSHSKILSEAFGKEVFAEGNSDDSNNSSRIEINPGKDNASLIVLRLRAHKKSALKPMAEVEDAIRKKLMSEKSSHKAKEEGQALAKSLAKIGKIEEVSKQSKIKLVTEKGLPRFGKEPHSIELIKAAFKLGVPVKDKPLIGSLQLKNGDYVVYQVVASTPGKEDKQNKMLAKFYKSVHLDLMGRNAFLIVMSYLKRTAKIETNRKLATQEEDEN